MTTPVISRKTITVSPGLEPLLREIRTMMRELPRLVAEGEDGRYALVKGDDVLSVWDTLGDARQMGYEKFGLEPFLVHQIRDREIELYEGAELEIGPVCHPSLEKYRRTAPS